MRSFTDLILIVAISTVVCSLFSYSNDRTWRGHHAVHDELLELLDLMTEVNQQQQVLFATVQRVDIEQNAMLKTLVEAHQ